MQALAAGAQWIELQPVNQRVSGSFPSQGTLLVWGPGSQWGTQGRQPHNDVSLPPFLSPYHLSITKEIKHFKKPFMQSIFYKQ